MNSFHEHRLLYLLSKWISLNILNVGFNFKSFAPIIVPIISGILIFKCHNIVISICKPLDLKDVLYSVVEVTFTDEMVNVYIVVRIAWRILLLYLIWWLLLAINGETKDTGTFSFSSTVSVFLSIIIFKTKEVKVLSFNLSCQYINWFHFMSEQ